MKFIALVMLVSFTIKAQASEWTSLTADEFSLAAPPAVNSVEEKKDYNTLFAEQKQRTYAQCAHGNYQTLPTFHILFGAGIGIFSADLLTFEEYDSVKQVMKKVYDLTSKVSSAFKQRFHRARPYQKLKDLQPCLIKPGYDDSYPSGHAALGAIGGCLLAQRFPAKAESAEAQGRLVGELRVTGGVHHPTDIAAGQRLAQQICDRLLSDPAFRKDFGLATN